MRLKNFLLYLLLILVAAGAQPVGAAFWQWSKTADNNATADPTINWAEGMSPSSVNDSARAMMARAAEWRDDISGSVTTGGTSTAYTLATNQATGGNAIGSPPTDGQMLAFRASVTNGTSATMTVDGGTTYALQSPAGTALPAGTIIAGTPYRMQFNLANTSWVIEGITGNPYAVPLGAIIWSTSTTAPNSNFVAPSGQCLSTTTYASYWVQQGSPASGSCAGGQFQIIDMRGRVPAALDTLNASAANRLTNSATGCGTAMTSIGATCANGLEGSAISLAQMPVHSHANTVSETAHRHATIDGGLYGTQYSVGPSGSQYNGAAGSYQSIDLRTQQTGTATAGVTISNANAGSGTARPNVQPTIGLIPYLRVI